MVDIDRAAIVKHVRLLHTVAEPLVGEGIIVLACFGEDPDELDPKTGRLGRPLPPIVRHFAIGEIDAMAVEVARLTVQPHRNVYAACAVMRLDLPAGHKGAESDVVGVTAIVADFDDDDANNWRNRLTVGPDYALQSSSGRYQVFYLLDKPATVSEAKPIGERLRNFAKSDHGSLDASHVWRIAGSLNWPNRRKIARGRPPGPQLVQEVSLDA
jgi:hypothetical protein